MKSRISRVDNLDDIFDLNLIKKTNLFHYQTKIVCQTVTVHIDALSLWHSVSEPSQSTNESP